MEQFDVAGTDSRFFLVQYYAYKYRFCYREEAMREYIELVEVLAGIPASERDGAEQGDEEGFGTDASIKGFTMNADGSSGAADPKSSVDPSQPPQQRMDLTHWASVDDVKSVAFFLENQRVSPDYRDEDGLTALMRAADRDACGALRALLDAGADVSLADGDGLTALHYAALCGHARAAALLVRAGADVDVKDGDGDSAWDGAGEEVREAMERAKEVRWVDVDDVKGSDGWAVLGSGGLPERGFTGAACALVVGVVVVVMLRVYAAGWARLCSMSAD
jgi:Ankyrin repeats (3 copies)